MTNYYPSPVKFYWFIFVLLFFSPKISTAQNFCQAISTTLFVTNTDDNGNGSLRAAIECANAIPGPNNIHFNIAGSGPHIINVGSTTFQHLPELFDPGTIIDGSTQTGFTGDPLIILDGGSISWSTPINAIHIQTNNCEIYGLTIRNFPDDGIDLEGANNTRIGAPGKGNVIHSNGIFQDVFPDPNFPGFWNGCGIVVRSTSSNCSIQGNIIGTDFNQTSALGNEWCGIIVREFVLNLNIGGTNPGEGNIIANNIEGIRIDNSYNISMRENSMYCNDTTAIHLLNNGNQMKVPPIINISQLDYISGSGPSNELVEVFAVDDINCNGTPCQGRIHLGTVPVINGSWILTNPSVSTTLQAGMKVTATLTANNGTTSSFAPCRILIDASTCGESDGTIWVTNTDDDGLGSLRAAINCANYTAGPNVIKFNIPDSTIRHRIYVGSQTGQELPALLDASTTIDATTQPGYGVNDFEPKIIIDGSQNVWTIPHNAIWIRANSCEIYGFEIVNFPDDAIDVRAANFAIIGAPNKGNVIYNNGYEQDIFPGVPGIDDWNGCGVVMRNGSSFCTVQGNIIGTNYTQDSTGGNEFCGVVVQPFCQNNLIGGSGAGDANIIAYNDVGILIQQVSQFCRFQQNSMYCNDIGIVLQDTTSNQNQPAPVIDSVSTGVVMGTANPSEIIEVFINDTTNCSGVGCQGTIFLGETIAAADGSWNLSAPFANGNQIYGGSIITSTATDTLNNTSPFSNCMSVVIDCNSLVISFVNVENATCGLNNGTFEVVPNGGFNPYSFDFGNGVDTNLVRSNLAAGWYQVTLTDNNGCIKTDSIQIINVLPPTLTVDQTEDETCDLQNGSISLIATNGIPPYSFDMGSGPQSNPMFSNLNSGTYSITLTDASGCQDSVTVTLQNSSGPFIAVANLLNENCDMQDGAFTVVTLGGTAPFLYNIGNGDVFDPTFTGLGNGVYTVIVTDASGCTAAISAIVFDAPPILATIVNEVGASCNQNNGSFEVSATGGAGGFLYDIGNGQTNNNIFTNLAAGTYQVTITDVAGCTSVQTAIVNGSSSSPTFTVINVMNENCGQADGGFEISVNSGIAPFMYNIGSGNTSNPIFANINAASYNIVVTDATGCSISQVFTLLENNLSLHIDALNNPTCNQSNGSITVSGAGGNTPYLYDIGNGLSTNNIFPNLSSGTYDITVIDGSGCSTNQMVALMDAGIPSFSNINIIDENCGQINGGFDVTITGGTPPYNYDIGTGMSGSSVFYNLSAGSYDVTVSDNNGCTASQNININEIGITLNINGTSNATCGQTNGSITVSTSGGVGPFTYDIGNGGTNNNTFFNLTGGVYNITVTDGNGCVDDETVTLLGSGSVSFTMINIIEENCGQTDGSFEISASGGQAPYAYNIGSGNVNSPIYTNLNAADYNVVVTDANGCTKSQIFSLGENNITLNVDAAVDATCGQSNGSITLSTTGGVAPLTFDIGNGGTTNNVFSNLSAGTYNITVTDFYGCADTESVTLQSGGNAPAISISNVGMANCNMMDGTFTVNGSSGATPYMYDIGNGQTSNNIFSNLSSGLYTVTLTDDAGCTISESVTINGSEGPSLMIGDVINETCGMGNGIISLIGFGGTSPYTYDFGNGPTNSNGATNLSAGSYTVTITDVNGCSNQLTVQVSNTGILPNASYTYNNNVLTVDFTDASTGANGYLWDFGDGATSTLINPSHTYAENGNYDACLTVTNNCGSHQYCESVSVFQAVDVVFDLGEISGQAGDTVFANVVVNNFDDIVSFQKSIHVADTTIAKFIGVNNLNLANLSNGDFTINSQIITLNWASNASTGETVSDGTIIYQIAIELLVKLECTDLFIDGNPLPAQAVQMVNGNNTNIGIQPLMGEVCVTGALGNTLDIAGLIFRENGETIADVDVTCTNAPNPNYTTNSTGAYEFLNLPQGGNFTVTPFKNNNPANGLTGLDLAKIQQHIIGMQLLDSPYKIIAADANNSGSITALDLVAIQNVITGLATSFPNNTSWRFIPEEFVFINPSNPFDPVNGIIPEEIILNNLTADSLTEHFIAIKIGDVNLSSSLNLTGDGSESLTFQVAPNFISNDNVLLIDFKAKQFKNILAWQMDLGFDATRMEFLEIVNVQLPDFRESNYGRKFLKNGVIPMVWSSPRGIDLEDDEVVFSIKFKVTDDFVLDENTFQIKRDRMPKVGFKDGKNVDVNLLLEKTESLDNLEEAMTVQPNYPNPFESSTQINFYLPFPNIIYFSIFDLTGRKIYQLEQRFEAGENKIEVDGTILPEFGLYYYQLNNSENQFLGKMIFKK